MNRTLLTGVGIGLALAGLAAIVISDPTEAAPYNAVTTKQTDLAYVSSLCVDRQKLADGGFQDTLRSYVTVPTSTSLPDAGTETATAIFEGSCALGGAAKTALDNFADGAALVCARAANRLER